MIEPTAKGGRKVALCMIMRDDGHVIERCLRSVRAHIDVVYVEINGDSIDLESKLQEVGERLDIFIGTRRVSWRGFGSARRSAREACSRLYPEHIQMFMDADDEFVSSGPLDLENGDYFTAEFQYGNTRYNRVILASATGGNWSRHPVHEVFVPSGRGKQIQNAFVRILGGGSSHTNTRKYSGHYSELMRFVVHAESHYDYSKSPSIDTKNDVHRALFYAARSAEDACRCDDLSEVERGQMTENGKKAYRRCIENVSHWAQERYIAALCYFRLTGDMTVLVEAYCIDPTRFEAPKKLFDLSFVKDSKPLRLISESMMRTALRTSNPSMLFVEQNSYGRWQTECRGLAAYYSETNPQYELAKHYFEEALKETPVEDTIAIDRLKKNIEFAEKKLM